MNDIKIQQLSISITVFMLAYLVAYLAGYILDLSAVSWRWGEITGRAAACTYLASIIFFRATRRTMNFKEAESFILACFLFFVVISFAELFMQENSTQTVFLYGLGVSVYELIIVSVALASFSIGMKIRQRV